MKKSRSRVVHGATGFLFRPMCDSHHIRQTNAQTDTDAVATEMGGPEEVAVHTARQHAMAVELNCIDGAPSPLLWPSTLIVMGASRGLSPSCSFLVCVFRIGVFRISRLRIAMHYLHPITQLNTSQDRSSYRCPMTDTFQRSGEQQRQGQSLPRTTKSLGMTKHRLLRQEVRLRMMVIHKLLLSL